MTSRDLLDLVWIVPAAPARRGGASCCCSGKRIGEPLAGWIAQRADRAVRSSGRSSCFFALLDLPADDRVTT